MKKQMGLRTRPIITKKQLKQRRAVVLELLSEMEGLRAELHACRSVERQGQIASELGRLRRKQGRLLLVDKERKVAPLPPSFVERTKADRKATARVSGRDKIRAHFVKVALLRVASDARHGLGTSGERISRSYDNSGHAQAAIRRLQ